MLCPLAAHIAFNILTVPVKFFLIELSEGIDIDNFRSQHDNPGNYMVTQWIWWHDDQTKAELSQLEQEFAHDRIIFGNDRRNDCRNDRRNDACRHES